MIVQHSEIYARRVGGSWNYINESSQKVKVGNGQNGKPIVSTKDHSLKEEVFVADFCFVQKDRIPAWEMLANRIGNRPCRVP